MPPSLVAPYKPAGRGRADSVTGTPGSLYPYSAAEPRCTSRAAVPARSIALASAYVPVTLTAASTSGSPAVAPAQFTTASGPAAVTSAAMSSGSSLDRSTSRCLGEPGSSERPAVQTSSPAPAARSHTWRPRNPPAPMIMRRIRSPAPLRAPGHPAHWWYSLVL